MFSAERLIKWMNKWTNAPAFQATTLFSDSLPLSIHPIYHYYVNIPKIYIYNYPIIWVTYFHLEHQAELLCFPLRAPKSGPKIFLTSPHLCCFTISHSCHPHSWSALCWSCLHFSGEFPPFFWLSESHPFPTVPLQYLLWLPQVSVIFPQGQSLRVK